MKKIKNFISEKAAALASLAAVATTQVHNVMATTLWDKAEGASSSAITNLSSFYRHWFIVIFIIECVFYFITKDQRKKDIELKVLIGSVVVYILTSAEIQTMIIKTIDSIVGWF